MVYLVDKDLRKPHLFFLLLLLEESLLFLIQVLHVSAFQLKDSDKYSEEELVNLGANNSVIHVDFMVGTSDLNITGINKDGETIQIFSNGNWTF